MSHEFPMIDLWVNPNFPVTSVDPTVARLFPGLEERRRRGTSLAQLIEEMDKAGVERAILCAGYRGADNLPWVNAAIEAHPDRLSGSLVVDPREGMRAVRKLEAAVLHDGFIMARVMALETQLAYDHAAYFPVYAKCVELGVPIGVNVGIPGPAVPGRHQHPLPLDDVCCFFPDLKIIMAHGGDPWADICVKLMSKWENLYYMTSAYSPKRIPQEIATYANGRGSNKVMWASDYPILEFARCRDDIDVMKFDRQELRRRFAYDNARALFFADGAPTPVAAVASQETRP
jgi:predicted TIM-barrel fold metal-dependent hydrolase